MLDSVGIFCLGTYLIICKGMLGCVFEGKLEGQSLVEIQRDWIGSRLLHNEFVSHQIIQIDQKTLQQIIHADLSLYSEIFSREVQVIHCSETF